MVKNKLCEYCGNVAVEGRTIIKYCSKRCCSSAKKHKYIMMIESGMNVSTVTMRRYLMSIYNNKCQRCGWGEENPISKTVCLDLHHVDGNHKNNTLSNVELLCPNCHSITNTYKRVGSTKRKSTRNR